MRSGSQSTSANSPHLGEFANLALVATSLKVLYLPTPKAACTTIKTMLATAAGTHRPDMADRLAIMHVSRAQTIHHPAVHGLTRFADLPEREQREILSSPEWIRIASVRDPVSRAYSAWENRIFMRAHRRTTRVIEIADDVMTTPDSSGAARIDIAASFAHFARMLGEHVDAFMVDHHFWPQSRVVRADAVDYQMIARVDQPGQIDAVAALLRERSGRDVVAARLNEGLGVRVERVCDQHTANRLMATYESDYAAFGFSRREWPATVAPLVLSDTESRLLSAYRNAFERGVSVAQESQRRRGARYGVGQMRRALTELLRGNRTTSAKDIQP